MLMTMRVAIPNAQTLLSTSSADHPKYKFSLIAILVLHMFLHLRSIIFNGAANSSRQHTFVSGTLHPLEAEVIVNESSSDTVFVNGPSEAKVISCSLCSRSCLFLRRT